MNSDASLNEKGLRIFRDEASFQRMLNHFAVKQDAARYNVDWKLHLVALISAGEQPSGGYSVKVERIESNGKGVTTVTASLVKPKPGQTVTTALTYPFTFVSLHRTSDKIVLNWT